jgi:hypothetical protein
MGSPSRGNPEGHSARGALTHNGSAHLKSNEPWRRGKCRNTSGISQGRTRKELEQIREQAMEVRLAPRAFTK